MVHVIGHFRVALASLKRRASGESLIGKNTNETHFQVKGFALNLILNMGQLESRKWPIQPQFVSKKRLSDKIYQQIITSSRRIQVSLHVEKTPALTGERSPAMLAINHCKGSVWKNRTGNDRHKKDSTNAFFWLSLTGGECLNLFSYP